MRFIQGEFYTAHGPRQMWCQRAGLILRSEPGATMLETSRFYEAQHISTLALLLARLWRGAKPGFRVLGLLGVLAVLYGLQKALGCLLVMRPCAGHSKMSLPKRLPAAGVEIRTDDRTQSRQP